MQFDIARISVPFRMQPGLGRLTPDAVHLTPLRRGSALYLEKQALYARGVTRHAIPGFDPAPVLAAVQAQALRDGVSVADARQLPLELQVEEDLVVLDTATACVPWMCVSVPTRWAPEEKLGQTLARIHSPVADGQALAAALPHLLRVLANGTHWERYVWTLTASPCYDQHPGRHEVQPWADDPDPEVLAAHCWLRAERQTFIPLRDAQQRPGPQTVFTIRVTMEPLARAIRTPADARQLHAAIASMSDAVLAYKNITAARDRLLAWLAARS